MLATPGPTHIPAATATASPKTNIILLMILLPSLNEETEMAEARHGASATQPKQSNDVSPETPSQRDVATHRPAQPTLP